VTRLLDVLSLALKSAPRNSLLLSAEKFLFLYRMTQPELNCRCACLGPLHAPRLRACTPSIPCLTAGVHSIEPSLFFRCIYSGDTGGGVSFGCGRPWARLGLSPVPGFVEPKFSSPFSGPRNETNPNFICRCTKTVRQPKIGKKTKRSQISAVHYFRALRSDEAGCCGTTNNNANDAMTQSTAG
jgi:hypothetical protein